jgi:hypothetical protein
MTIIPETINSIAASPIAAQLAQRVINTAVGGLSHLVARNIKPHLNSFEKYLARAYLQCSEIRTLANRDAVYSINDLYVAGSYKSANRVYSEIDIIEKLRNSGRIIVVGFGGIGKTMLLKKLFIDIMNEPQGLIPVFIELRRLNNITTQNLSSYIRLTISGQDYQTGEEEFVEVLKTGRLCLIFDGFDELNDEIRRRVQSEILEISSLYHRTSIIVSSRIDNRFYSWDRFTIFEAQKFNKDQAKALVKKVDVERHIKVKFSNEIIDRQYAAYSSFLSTPLLIIIMLVTYRKYGEITPKLHIFYKHAFQALYSQHDANKEAFSRERKSGLDEEQFEKVFSVFCLLTYIDARFSLKLEDMNRYLNESKIRSNTDFDIHDFRREVVESVNLMYEDGDSFTFAHRSFQEYFAAKAIVTYFPGKVLAVIDRVSARMTDDIFRIAYELNPDVVEQEYVLPKLDYFINDYIYLTSADNTYLEKATRLGVEIGIEAEKDGTWMAFLMGEYPQFFRRFARFYDLPVKYSVLGSDYEIKGKPKIKEYIKGLEAKLTEGIEVQSTSLIVITLAQQVVEVDNINDENNYKVIEGFDKIDFSDRSMIALLKFIVEKFIADLQLVNNIAPSVRKRAEVRSLSFDRNF